MCGDGVANPGEECDGSDLAGQDCVLLGYDGGTLECDDFCVFNLKGCTMEYCGNGVLESPEECDGQDIGAADCIEMGEGPGTPGCTMDCKIDLAPCGLEGEGEDCFFSSDCGEGLYCEDFTCYDGSLGDPCADDMDCLGNSCEGQWGDNHCM